jgi:hypothetical protein
MHKERDVCRQAVLTASLQNFWQLQVATASTADVAAVRVCKKQALHQTDPNERALACSSWRSMCMFCTTSAVVGTQVRPVSVGQAARQSSFQAGVAVSVLKLMDWKMSFMDCLE